MTYRNHLKQIADDGVPRGPEAVFDRAVLTGSDPGIRRSVASRGRNLVLIVAGAGVAAGLIAIATIRRPTTERTTTSPSVSTMPLSALPPISTSSTTQPVATSSVTTAPTALTITAPTIFETPLAPFTGDDLADCVSLARSSAASIPAGYTIDVGRPMGYPARGCELFYRSDGQPSLAIARASKPQTGSVDRNGQYRFGRTEDSDETIERWATGTQVFADPTGPDINHLNGMAQVTMLRADGQLITVTTYTDSDLSDLATARAVAQLLDSSLA